MALACTSGDRDAPAKRYAGAGAVVVADVGATATAVELYSPCPREAVLPMIRFIDSLVTVVATGALLAACGGSQTQPSQGFCPLTVPWVQLLYPIPGTQDVSPNVGQMVFAATGVTRIQLAKRFYPYFERIATKPEPLPYPLPTPIATPGPYGQFLTTRFAVSFKALTPHTKYEARAWEVYNQSSCQGGEAVPPGWADIASFSTQ